MKENAQLLLSAELDKELREEEIEQGGLEARMSHLTTERSEKEEHHLGAIAAEFEKDLLKDSDVERVLKAQRIKKNFKIIKKGKRKKQLPKEVAKQKSHLSEKRKIPKGTAKKSALKIRKKEMREGSRTPTSPERRGAGKGKKRWWRNHLRRWVKTGRSSLATSS